MSYLSSSRGISFLRDKKNMHFRCFSHRLVSCIATHIPINVFFSADISWMAARSTTFLIHLFNVHAFFLHIWKLQTQVTQGKVTWSRQVTSPQNQTFWRFLDIDIKRCGQFFFGGALIVKKINKIDPNVMLYTIFGR